MEAITLENKETLWTRTFTLLFCTNLLMWSGFSLLISTMPLYVLHIGADQSQVGLVVGVYPLAALFSRPYAGYAYDAFGRKIVFLISLTLFTFFTFGYIVSATLLALILIRILQGLFFGITTTGAGTIVADIVPLSRRGEGVGYAGLGNTLAMAIGPAIGIWIMNTFGIAVVFYSAGIMMTLSLIMAFFVSYPKITVPKKKLALGNIIEKRVLSVAAVTVIVGSITGALLTYVIVFSEEIGLINGGLYFMLNAGGVAFSRLFAGRMMDKNGPRSVFMLGLVAMILGVALLASSKEMILYGIASAVIGVGNGIAMPTLQAMVINMVEEDRRAAATATHLTAVDAGISGGSIILGYIAGFTSLATMFLLCAVILVIPIALFNLYVLKDYESKTAQAQSANTVLTTP